LWDLARVNPPNCESFWSNSAVLSEFRWANMALNIKIWLLGILVGLPVSCHTDQAQMRLGT
jgi:hypothetical protein